MKFLVTGGAGFIGSNFVRGLLDGRWTADVEEVTVLDLFTYAGRRENLSNYVSDARLKIVVGSILDSSLVKPLMEQADYVVHFAAESHVDRSITSPHTFVETNVSGTQTLLDAARVVDQIRFIHVSTDEVYGSIAFGSACETDPLQPNSPYSASKAASDLFVRAYAQTFGLDAVITRCSNNYGPYQHPEKLIPRFITRVLNGRRVPLFGSGSNVRDWLHVDDHCSGIFSALVRGQAGEIYNIGGGTELDNLSITRLILSLMNQSDDLIEYVPDRPGHDFRYSIDWSKAKSELQYQPTKSLESELPRLIQWYLENRVWWESLIAD